MDSEEVPLGGLVDTRWFNTPGPHFGVPPTVDAQSPAL